MNWSNLSLCYFLSATTHLSRSNNVHELTLRKNRLNLVVHSCIMVSFDDRITMFSCLSALCTYVKAAHHVKSLPGVAGCFWLEEALLLLFIYTKKSKTTVFFWTNSRCPSKTCSLDCNSITIDNSAHTHLNQLFFSIF